jgi:hypothetical protein
MLAAKPQSHLYQEQILAFARMTNLYFKLLYAVRGCRARGKNSLRALRDLFFLNHEAHEKKLLQKTLLLRSSV